MRGDRFHDSNWIAWPIGAAIAAGTGVVFAPLILGALVVAVGMRLRAAAGGAGDAWARPSRALYDRTGSGRSDVHAHVCDACGNAWTHDGRSSAGLQAPHTCQRCGALQWWRPGEREMLGDPRAVFAMNRRAGAS